MKLTDKQKNNELKRRMLTVKSKFPFKDYATVYQYEYGKLEKKEIDHLYKVWNLISTDQKIVSRFEKIIEQI